MELLYVLWENKIVRFILLFVLFCIFYAIYDINKPITKYTKCDDSYYRDYTTFSSDICEELHDIVDDDLEDEIDDARFGMSGLVDDNILWRRRYMSDYEYDNLTPYEQQLVDEEYSSLH